VKKVLAELMELLTDVRNENDLSYYAAQAKAEALIEKVYEQGKADERAAVRARLGEVATAWEVA